MRPAWLEIDLGAIAHNMSEIRRIIGPDTGIVAVVKSNAYGHGAVPAARQVLDCGACMLAVALLQEAVELRQAGIDAPILVLGATDPSEAPGFVEHGVCAAVADVGFARELSAAAGRAGTRGLCHVKIDSGMGRQGVRADEVAVFGKAVRDLPGIDIQGAYSHFASSPTDREFTERQITTFSTAVAELQAVVGKQIPLRHLANSGAVVRHENARMDAVRPGALIYGIADRDAGECLPTTKQAMTLQSRIVTTKPIRRGESVGYGRTFIARQDLVAAVLPIGYADGYPRALSGNADVLVRGTRCPVIGRVSMDCTMVDITRAGEVMPGQQVVLLGRQGDEMITTGELARRCNTCVEEIVSRVAARLPRVYIGADQDCTGTSPL